MAQIQEESINCEGDWTATSGTCCGACCVSVFDHWFRHDGDRAAAHEAMGVDSAIKQNTAVGQVKEMLTSQTDLDIIIGLLRDHYGIDVLIMPENVDRLAMVTLANRVHDCGKMFNEREEANARKLARIVLDLMVDHGAEPAT